MDTSPQGATTQAGALIDLMQHSNLADVCRQHYSKPVSCTPAVFAAMETAIEDARTGILHELLIRSKYKKLQLDENTAIFRCVVMGHGSAHFYDFMLRSGDKAITIALVDEI